MILACVLPLHVSASLYAAAVVRAARVPMPTTLRALETAPVSSEQVLSFEEESDGGDSDDIDVDEFDDFV